LVPRGGPRPKSDAAIVVCCDGAYDPVSDVAVWAWVAWYGNFVTRAYGPAELRDSNAAEYAALMAAIRWLLKSGYSNETIEVFSDNDVCICHLLRSETRNRWHDPTQARDLLGRFRALTIRWVSRAWNKDADALARKAIKMAREGALTGTEIHSYWRGW